MCNYCIELSLIKDANMLRHGPNLMLNLYVNSSENEIVHLVVNVMT